MRRSLPTLGDVIIYIAILLLLFGPKPLALGQDHSVAAEEIDLGRPSDAEAFKNDWLFISPDSAHVAYWGGNAGGTMRSKTFTAGDDVCLVVDGKPQGSFTMITEVAFSPDGKHVAYFAGKKDSGLLLVVDGKEQDHGVDRVNGAPIFSRDGNRVAYLSQPEEKTFAVVVDGKRQYVYDGIGAVVFSDDGTRLAYAARRGETWMAVVDGVAGKPYPQLLKDSIQFSPDGKHTAYIAKLAEGQWVMVLDGKETKPMPNFNVGSPRFSPDGKQLGVIVCPTDDTMQVVVNGKPKGERFDQVDPFVFSPDSKHIAYAARRGEKWMIVHDGVAGKAYDDVRQPPVFSKDGSTIIYAAKSGDTWRVVVRDVEQQPFESVSGMCVSDDGRHVAYVGTQAGQHLLVVDDDVRHGNKTGLGPIALSPDGSNIVYWWPEELGHWVLFANGALVETYDGMIKGSRIEFDANDRGHALGHRRGHVYRIDLQFGVAPPVRVRQ